MTTTKRCKRCEKSFKTKTNSRLYCDDCSGLMSFITSKVANIRNLERIKFYRNKFHTDDKFAEQIRKEIMERLKEEKK